MIINDIRKSATEKYVLINGDDPLDRTILTAETYLDAYFEALEYLGYNVMVEDVGDEDNVSKGTQ